MLAVCHRFIPEVGEAEDAMIRGFQKVFEKLNQFTSKGSFEGWVRRIMINESLGYLRQNKTLYLEVEIDKAYFEPCQELPPTNLEAEDLFAMILRLPAGYRTVFNLYAIEGYSHKEIGEFLGINESTSKSQLSRARKILQRFVLDSERTFQKNLSHESS